MVGYDFVQKLDKMGFFLSFLPFPLDEAMRQHFIPRLPQTSAVFIGGVRASEEAIDPGYPESARPRHPVRVVQIVMDF